MLTWVFVLTSGAYGAPWIERARMLLACILIAASAILLLLRSPYAVLPFLLSYVFLIVKILMDPPIFVWNHAFSFGLNGIICLLFFMPSVRKPKSVAN